MPGFYESLGKSSPSAPGTEAQRTESGFYATLHAGKKAAKAAAIPILKKAGDIIGPPARFLGSAMELPIAAGLHYGLGTNVPVEFSPEAGMKQFESPQGQSFLRTIAGPLPPFTPAAADVAANLALAGPMNALGRGALMPLAKAGLEPLRGLPFIKEALEFPKTGASLPAEYRGFVQDLLRSAEGQKDLSAYTREKLLTPVLKMSVEEQDALRHAIETGTVDALPKPQQDLAHSLIASWQNDVKERVAAGLKPFERRPGVEYAGGRVATTESRAEMFKGQPRLRFSSQPGGLSTGQMGQISKENLPLTTREVAAKVSGAVPTLPQEKVFEPLGKASAISGMKHDTRVMHAKILTELIDRFGQDAKPYESIAATHPGVATGFAPGMEGLLKSRKLPPKLDELVTNLDKRLQPEEFGRITRAMKWMNQGFKKWALFSSGYTSRNLQNNLFQIAVNEGLSPVDIKNMPGIMATLAKPTPDKIEEWIRLGVSGRGQTAREIGKSPGLMGIPRAGNAMIEDKSRELLYEMLVRKGKSPVEAAKRVDDLLFNYSQTFASRARRTVGQKYVPFVNWAAMIPGLTARTMIERPGSVGLLSNLRDRQNRSLGYDDAQLAKEFGPWNIPQGVTAYAPGKAFIPQFAGQYSVNDVVPTSLTEALDKLLSKVYPTGGVPIALGTGREPFSSRPFKYGEKDRFTKAPSSLRVIFKLPGGPEFAQAHGISIDPDTKQVIAPARLAYLLGSIPQRRVVDLVADYAAGVKGKEQTLGSFGLGIRTVNKYVPKQKKR